MVIDTEREIIEHLICKEQGGFRERERENADQILTLRVVADKILRERKETICCINGIGEGI